MENIYDRDRYIGRNYQNPLAEEKRLSRETREMLKGVVFALIVVLAMIVGNILVAALINVHHQAEAARIIQQVAHK